CAVKTWDGSNWNPAGNPTATDHVVISDDYDTATDGGSITACEVTVDASTTLTISADDFLSVANNITVDGTLNVAHTANVVQIDDAATVTNNGTINVYVDTPALDGRDFMLMGSPMTTETRAGVFDGAMRIRNHLTENFSPNTEVMEASNGAGVWVDEEGDDWLVYEAGINPGEGYMVMRDIVGPATALNLNFTQGTLNNGVITYAAEYNGTQNASPNIIANPYASAISATDFINANDNVDAVYFWEHITAPNSGTPGPYGLDYTMEDISIFNLTGGTSAAGSDAGTLPNGIISTGQGFGVKASNAEPITFNNSMRLTSGNTTLRKRDIDRIWLNVQSNGYELNSTALIGFIQEATDGIDIGYDAKRLATNVALYSHLDDGSNQLGIQSRGVFSENMKIPMGFATLIDEQINYTISIENIEGLNLESATVYLIDNQEETITNLSNEDYTFGSEKGIFDNRFTIQFVPEVILGTDASVLENIAIYPNPTQSILSIVSPKFMVTNVTVYDIIGRVVMSQNFENSKKVAIDLSELNSAIYFAEINTEAGKMTKRIIKE
ncbi:T9SS type A sorting domain-containing protein, partial [Ulvibacter litoralis]